MFDHRGKTPFPSSEKTSISGPVQELPAGGGVEVDQSSWGAFRSEDAVISTGGLGPCCGIAVFDSHSKIATVGHFVCLAVESHLVTEMFDFLSSTIADPTTVSVTVGGLSPMGNGVRGSAEATELRRSVVSRLESLGISTDRIVTCWAEEDTTVILDILTETGQIEAASYDISDDPDLFV
jgi:hypothetical protein